jgi:hypothetical protein
MKTLIFLATLLSVTDAFMAPTTIPKIRTFTQLHADAAATKIETTVEPKEAVKIFGRLAEKYIMLDSSGGMCCYSACKDCEYRLPGGGYKMADQSAARPKWIPSYEERVFESVGKEHASAWGKEVFSSGPYVIKEEFVERVKGMKFSPPLGGPYRSASAAGIEDDLALETFFDLLAGEKERLTKHRMSTRIKEIANGNEGLIWSDFMAALSE